MNNKVVIGGNLKLKNVVSGQAKLNNVISGTPNTSIRAGGRGGISNAVKEALLDCFEHVAWIDDDGQVYYQALYDALYAKVLTSITAVFEQGQAVIYDDDTLDDLKQYLTVTANYDDGTSAVITTYTLSGTLNPGTSSIQVSYGNKKAYFNVTVTHRPGVVTITNTLNGCTTSNDATSTTEGASYSATITASSGYVLTGASVSITMGGVDITSSAYSNGSINIAEVTGSLVITITAVAVTVASISAVYTQSGTVYENANLDDLKTDLVVTATYSDSSTATVPSAYYTLSGTLTVGTSTITVTYESKTTTFNVTVSQMTALYDWDFTTSLVDSKQSLTATTNGTQDSNGLTFSQGGRYLELSSVFSRNRTYEIDVESIARKATSNYGRLFMVDSDTNTATGGSGYILSGTKKGGDLFYMNGAWESNKIVSSTIDLDGSYYSNSTVGFYVDNSGYCHVYKNGTLLGTSSTAFAETDNGKNVYIGSSGNTADYLNDSVFTGFRIYEGNIYS